MLAWSAPVRNPGPTEAVIDLELIALDSNGEEITMWPIGAATIPARTERTLRNVIVVDASMSKSIGSLTIKPRERAPAADLTPIR